MEAKFAYHERKAEIVAERKTRTVSKKDRDLRRAVTELHIEDSRSERSDTSRRHHSHRGHRETERHARTHGLNRHQSGSSVGSRRDRDDSISPRSPDSPRSSYRSPRTESVSSRHSRSAPTSPILPHPTDRRSLELVRRRTDTDLAQLSPTRRASHPLRSISTTAVDMDLAYGDYHHSSIAPLPNTGATEENELLTLVDRARLLLDEANCAQHSVRAMIEHLQQNPDAMAAVALTLAEISNLASKMAPGALAALKGSAPAVFALLASPQFLIAAGVGIGVTVVMFGGYKIIKKIKAKNAAGKADIMEDMLEIDGEEINRINQWRRGIMIDESEVSSVAGTSVEGEFITPLAASMRGMETREDLLAAGLSDKERKKREKKENKQRKKEKGRSIKARSEDDDARTEKTERSSSSPSRSTRLAEDFRRKALVKVKKPSPLRRLLA